MTLHHTGEAIINPPAYQIVLWTCSVSGTLLWEDHLCYLPVTSGCFPCPRLASLSLTPLCRAPGIWSKVHGVSVENHLEAENGLWTIALGKIGSFYNSTSLLAFSLKPSKVSDSFFCNSISAIWLHKNELQHRCMSKLKKTLLSAVSLNLIKQDWRLETKCEGQRRSSRCFDILNRITFDLGLWC